MYTMKTFKLDTEPKIPSGFTTPENYFDDFTEKIMQQLPKNEPKIIPVFARRRTWVYTAAAILIVALAIPIYLTFISHSSEIDDKTIENYITYHSTVSDTDLVNLLEEEDIDKMSSEMNIEDGTIEDELLGNKNLEQYLIN
jgi:hypothetical protein